MKTDAIEGCAALIEDLYAAGLDVYVWDWYVVGMLDGVELSHGTEARQKVMDAVSHEVRERFLRSGRELEERRDGE